MKCIEKTIEKVTSEFSLISEAYYIRKELALDYVDFIKENWKKLLTFGLLSVLVLWYLLITVMKTDEVVTISHVTPKMDTYFILTDKGAFTFRTSVLFLQPEVANRIGSLHEGKTYKLTHYGVRIPIFNMYENIIDFELMPSQELPPY